MIRVLVLLGVAALTAAVVVAQQTRSPDDVGASSARLSDRAVVTAPAPAHLALPRLGVDAEVVDVGVDLDGQMSVPSDVAEVGWYRHGPVPGAAGSAVLAGHVDSRTQGLGVIAGLTRLAVGDEVVVTDVAELQP